MSPPVVQGSTDVPYPAGASGDAAVVLELVVGSDGAVSTATVIEGAPPFAEPARVAALAWRFAPARRGAAAVSARIRARVEFHQEPAAAVSPGPLPKTAAGDAATTPDAFAAGPPPERPLDVTVRGARREIGQTTLSAVEVRELPGAFGDPFRAIEALPGVTPLVSGLPYFYIRGAPPNDNGYFVDGIRVPLLFHLGIGQGVLHPGLIERVDFFPGAPPASYGGVAGAVIAGQTRAPASAPHGEAKLRLVDVGGLVEVPVDDGRVGVLVGGRYGYPGPILGAVTSGLTLSYWDYQARATARVGARDVVGLFAFGSHDALATPSPSGDPTARPIEQFVSDFHRLDLRYDHELADGHVRVAVTGGHDRQGAAPTYVTDTVAALRLEVERGLWPTVRARGGAAAQLDRYGLEQLATGPGDPVAPSTADPPPTNVTAGAHADVVWRATPRVELVPGARFDVFASSRADAPGSATRVRTAAPAFDPRLSARVALTPSVAWLAAVGLSHQFPALRAGNIPAALVSVPGFPLGERQLQTAAQVSQGLEVALPAEVVVGATGFVSRWTGLTDLTAICEQLMPGSTGPQAQPPPYVCPDNHPVRGHAYGLEVLVRRPFSKRLSGWLSYTLSRSRRQAHFVTATGGDAVDTVPSEGDRRHVLNAIVGYELGRRWRVGGRLLFFTGSPYSRTDGNIPTPPYNQLRLPAFFRVDLRLEKRWSLGKSGSLALVFEGQNILLRKEYVVTCDIMGTPDGTSTTRCGPGAIGPLAIPSVGLEAFF